MPRAPLVGQRIRKRRQELGETQAALAARLGISSSYLNLIEHNKRPISGKLLHRIAATIGLDSRALAGTEEDRLIAELGEVAADAAQLGINVSADTAGDIVSNNPEAARAMLGLYRAYREARVRSDLLGERLGEDSFLAEASQQILTLITTIRSYAEILKDYGDLSDEERSRFATTLVDEAEALATRATDMFDFMSGRGDRRSGASPREEIEDFISDRSNYFPRLEDAAERTLALLPAGATLESMSDLLRRRHGISVQRKPAIELAPGSDRPDDATFFLSDSLGRGHTHFQVARLFGTLEYGDILDALIDGAVLASSEAKARLRRTLAGYFAAALMMPYAPF
ncbi:MAG: helix-turn-helix domain-containing protein, partial [Pseudolabrys sp.]|nr:helix-turn-helix domain-containing protein [Pseudolabrys sp.]